MLSTGCFLTLLTVLHVIHIMQQKIKNASAICFCVDTVPTCSMGVDIWSPLMSMLMPMSDVNLDMLEQVIIIMTIIVIMKIMLM